MFFSKKNFITLLVQFILICLVFEIVLPYCLINSRYVLHNSSVLVHNLIVADSFLNFLISFYDDESR